jgi:DNA topoisomerase IB
VGLNGLAFFCAMYSSTMRVPLAYHTVKFYKNNASGLHATAVSPSGKTQYFYTPEHNRQVAREKWQRLRAFSSAVPTIRERFWTQATPHQRLVMQLMDECGMRVGAETATSAIGATGITRSHLRGLRLNFVGKSAKENTCDVSHELARSIRALRAGDANLHRKVAALMKPFTPKDFRMYRANVEYVHARRSSSNHAEAVRQAALHINNTAAICEKYYLAPFLKDVTYARLRRSISDESVLCALLHNARLF